MIKLPKIGDANDIAGKKVFVRGDIDVPLEQVSVSAGDPSTSLRTKVADDSRLCFVWPTVEFLLKQNCQVVLAGHLGRPEGKIDWSLSSKPVTHWILNKIKKSDFGPDFAKATTGRRGQNDVSDLDLGFIKGFKVAENFTVLENLRFDPREEANDEGFAKELAGLAEVYVNECFAVDERSHASVVGVPKFLPHFAGFRLSKELEMLGKVLENPVRPLVVIIGGAKLETKIPVISKMAEHADTVIVGGKLLTEIIVGSPIMAMEKVKLLRLTENGKDTTLESIDRVLLPLLRSLSFGGQSGTIVWNGPVGQIEDYNYQVGTRRIAELVAASKGYKIAGGGDTIGILDKLGLTEKFDWVSCGGGSMLKLLAGESLPGVQVLLS